MSITFRKLHPVFAAEASPIHLRTARVRETLEHIRDGMDEHAVLVFRNQTLTIQEQVDFAQRVGDLVIWDNLATMHRGTRFDDGKYHRELRRVTTIDVQYDFENLRVAESA